MPTRRSRYAKPWIAYWRVHEPFAARTAIKESTDWRHCRDALALSLADLIGRQHPDMVSRSMTRIMNARVGQPMTINTAGLQFTIRRCECDSCKYGVGCAVAR